MSADAWNRDTTSEEVCARFADQIKGRRIYLTGPTVTGVGWATAAAIAEQGPSELVLAGRSVGKLEEAKKKILERTPGANVSLLQMDLSSMASVRQAAKKVVQEGKPVDVLINNAGVMDTPFTVTDEGNELQFASNYLGHWLFTLSILELIMVGQNKRIVNVSSSGHANGQIRWDDPAFDKGYNKKEAYGQSKTALNLFTMELARRYGQDGLVAMSLDPGGISTPLQQYWSKEERIHVGEVSGGAFNPDGSANHEWKLWKSPSQGGSTSCRAAFDPEVAAGGNNGKYMVDCQVAEDKCEPHAKDPQEAQRLWGWTDELLGV